MAKKAGAAKKVAKLSFEQALEQLETITARLDRGEIGLEDSIEQFEEAVALHDHCRQILDRAELRIKQIRFDTAGEAELRDAPELGGEAEAADEDA